MDLRNERKGLIIDDVPMENVELGIRHGVDVLLQDTHAQVMAGSVQHHSAMTEARRVLDGDLLNNLSPGSVVERQLGERFETPQRAKD